MYPSDLQTTIAAISVYLLFFFTRAISVTNITSRSMFQKSGLYYQLLPSLVAYMFMHSW
jgi:hypothetical protein